MSEQIPNPDVWHAEDDPSRRERSPFSAGEAIVSRPGHDRDTIGRDWLESAAELLGEPDPGPVPWLVDGLIVDQSIAAVVGRWKVTKSFALLDIAISVVTGEPFLGRFEIPQPGPVVLVLEESGRAALWRRLDYLCRGRAIDRERLAPLAFAANRRVRLDDPGWQGELLAAGRELRPRLFILDPLARLKSPARDENAQREYSVIVDFIRRLRDETEACVAFVQHTGHLGDHMRGTSDLESVWESRLAFARDGGTITIRSEHREAEEGPTVSYRLDWDERSRSIRLDPVADDLPTLVAGYLQDHPDASANEVQKAVGGRKQDVLAEVRRQRGQVVPVLRNHPEPPAVGTPCAVVPPTPSLPLRGEGSGTTRDGAGSRSPEPPLFDDVERLADRCREDEGRRWP